MINPQWSGSYKAISRLAGGLNCDDTAAASSGNATATVMIEEEKSVVLIKEYHGRVVVFRVPSSC